MTTKLTLRPAVLAFAEAMEMRLREKDKEMGGDSWPKSSLGGLYSCLQRKVISTRETMVDASAGLSAPHEVSKHVVDVANYTMMIYDNAKEGIET